MLHACEGYLFESGDPPRFVPVPDSRPVDLPWPAMMWPVPADIELVGRSVRLTRLNPDVDAAEVFRALDDERVWSHGALRPLTEPQLTALLRDRHADPTWQLWTVRTASQVAGLPADTIVGVTAYRDVAVFDARMEIGLTRYAPLVWGTSVNPDTKFLLLDYAFGTLGVGRVQLKADARNVRSQQAIARLGATYEGTLRRHGRRDDGTMRDSVLFAITAEEWPDVRMRLRERIERTGRRDTMRR